MFDVRGDKILKILETLEKQAYNLAGFAAAFLSSTKSNYLPLRNFSPHDHKTAIGQWREELREKQKIYGLINHLKLSGLISVAELDDRRIIKITGLGRKKIDLLKKDRGNSIPVKKYKTQQSEDILIVGFDIPEKEKRKRNWLRAILKNLGFSMLQKSVWVGKVKLPEEFLSDLGELKILPYLEIFSVGKKGTITKIE